MTTIVPFGIIGVVISFVIAALGLFPGDESSSGSTAGTSDTYSEESVQEAGNRFYSVYAQVIDDMMSYQSDPDFLRAEQEQEAMNAFAEALLPMFQEFTDQMDTEFDELNAEAEALAEATTGS